MHRSLLVRQLLPACVGYAALIAAALGVDSVLHRLGLGWVGLWLGPAGALLLLVSFVYSLRKRRLIAAGEPRALLGLHESLGWSGALLILVHGGAHFSALLPWLALLAMLIVVASGFAGSVLLKRASETVRARAGSQGGAGVLLDALTLDAMKRWRAVHMPLNAVFLVLTLIHLGAVLFFRSW